MKKVSGVYIIRNTINLKCYIGSSVNIRRRWYGHKNQARKKIHHSRLFQHDWDLYGEEAFEFNVLEYMEPNNEKLHFNEQSCIWLYNPQYNGFDKVLNNSICPEKIKGMSERMTNMNKGRVGGKISDIQQKRMTLSKMKLTESQVFEIAKIYQDGFTQRFIAKKYNVLETTINRIVNNKIKCFSNLIPNEFKRKPMTRIDGILRNKNGNVKSPDKSGRLV